MSLPPYSPESDKPSTGSRAAVALGSALVGFISFFLLGGLILFFVQASFFGWAGIIYAAMVGASATWLLKAPKYRGFVAGIFCAIACYAVLSALAADFARGFWK